MILMGPFQPGLPYDSMVPAGPVSSPFISSHLNLRPRALPLWKGRLRSLTDHTEHCRLTQEITIWLKAGKQHPTARRSGIKDTGKEQKQLRFASSHYPLLASHFNAENPRFYSPRAVPGAPLLPRGCSRGVNRGPAAGRSLERSSETQHGAHCPRPSGPHLRAAGRRSAAFGLNGRAPRVAPHGPAVSTATARCQDGGGAGSACVGGWGVGERARWRRGAGRGAGRGAAGGRARWRRRLRTRGPSSFPPSGCGRCGRARTGTGGGTGDMGVHVETIAPGDGEPRPALPLSLSPHPPLLSVRCRSRCRSADGPCLPAGRTFPKRGQTCVVHYTGECGAGPGRAGPVPGGGAGSAPAALCGLRDRGTGGGGPGLGRPRGATGGRCGASACPGRGGGPEGWPLGSTPPPPRVRPSGHGSGGSRAERAPVGRGRPIPAPHGRAPARRPPRLLLLRLAVRSRGVPHPAALLRLRRAASRPAPHAARWVTLLALSVSPINAP